MTSLMISFSLHASKNAFSSVVQTMKSSMNGEDVVINLSITLKLKRKQLYGPFKNDP